MPIVNISPLRQPRNFVPDGDEEVDWERRSTNCRQPTNFTAEAEGWAAVHPSGPVPPMPAPVVDNAGGSGCGGAAAAKAAGEAADAAGNEVGHVERGGDAGIDVIEVLLQRLREDVEAAFCRHERALRRRLPLTADRGLAYPVPAEQAVKLPRCEPSSSEGGDLVLRLPRQELNSGPGGGSVPEQVRSRDCSTNESAAAAAAAGSWRPGRLEQPKMKRPEEIQTSRRSRWDRQLVRVRSSSFLRAKTWLLTKVVPANATRLVGEDSKIRKITKHPLYSAMRAMVIILDAVLVVLELEHACGVALSGGGHHGIPDDLSFMLLWDICGICLITDLVVQMILEYPKFDVIRGRTGYRWFNIIVLVVQLCQMIGQHKFQNERSWSTFRVAISQLSILRLMRVVVVLPEIGLMRQHQQMGDFRIVIRSLTGALPPLLWCSATLFVILITVGTLFTEGTLAFVVRTGLAADEEFKLLTENFGTLFRSWLSLYKAILGGMDWGDLYSSMTPLAPHVKIMFLVFICFTFVAMMNIVTAVFIKSAFVRSENDRDWMIQQEQDAKRGFLDTMRGIFCGVDEDDDGKIGFKELEAHLQDPEVGAYFSKLGVDANEVEKLFFLLDEDGSGTIDREEFMFGCLRLKGEAKSLDLAILHQEVKTLGERFKDVSDMRSHLERVEAALMHLLEAEVDHQDRGVLN